MLLLTGLGWLCQEVWDRETFGLDTTLLLALHHWSTPTLDRLMVSVTRLGDPELVVAVVLVNLVWFLSRGRMFTAWMLIVACAGALVLNQGLKLAFARPRPVLWSPLIHETSYGFPSGHALGSLVLYGFLAHVYACWYPRQSRWIYGITTSAITLIGFSRLYLGVHFPTDIVAGYSVGFLWLLLCIYTPRIAGRKLSS
jgi:undecaprenyl-diphosphatase